ncbi:575_t:CDS:2, partial [Paraglomus occultum]
MSLNTDQSKNATPFLKSTRGRKRKTPPKDLDPTGRNHFMVVEKRRVTEKRADVKREQRLSSTVEQTVSIVNEPTQKPAAKHEHTDILTINIERQELALMTTEELRTYAKYIETTL